MNVIQRTAQEMILAYDSKAKSMYGTYQGYTIAMNYRITNRQTDLGLCVAVCTAQGTYPDRVFLQKLVDSYNSIRRFEVQGYGVTFIIKRQFTDGKTSEEVKRLSRALLLAFQKAGYVNCDQMTGVQGETRAYLLSGKPALLGEEGAAEMAKSCASAKKNDEQIYENVLMGIIGAGLGAVVGGIAILLMGQLGYISAAAGLLMGFLTMGGYRKFAGKLTVKGVVIGCILMFVCTFFAEKWDYAFYIWRAMGSEYDLSVREAYNLQSLLVEMGAIEKSDYIMNFVKVLVLSFGAAMITAFVFLGNKLEQYKIRRLGS